MKNKIKKKVIVLLRLDLQHTKKIVEFYRTQQNTNIT